MNHVHRDLRVGGALPESSTGAVLRPFLYLSALGLLLSAAAHVCSLLGVSVPGGKAVWGLHIGIFVVWIPTVVVSARMMKGSSRRHFWKYTLAGCPSWMRYVLFALFVYAAINFVYFVAAAPAHGRQPSGVAPTPAVLRGFSGHWMVFYAAAFALLYARIHAPQQFVPRQCRCGHRVEPDARFCPECGSPVANAVARTTP